MSSPMSSRRNFLQGLGLAGLSAFTVPVVAQAAPQYSRLSAWGQVLWQDTQRQMAAGNFGGIMQFAKRQLHFTPEDGCPRINFEIVSLSVSSPEDIQRFEDDLAEQDPNAAIEYLMMPQENVGLLKELVQDREQERAAYWRAQGRPVANISGRMLKKEKK